MLLSAGLAPWHATADERPVLHEYVPAVSDDEVLEWQASSGAPAAIVYDGEVLAAPNLTAAEPPGPRMVGLPGDGLGRDEPGRRSPEFRPDRLTTLEQDVDYSVAFAPSVMPHKRVSALDRVVLASDGVPVLTAPTRPPEELPVAGASGAGRDRFWGSVTLDFRAGLRVPIPSVSPESNILSVQTEPRVPLLFERDEAGNYFVRATPGAPSVVRLAFLMDAPVGYFNRPLPDAGFPVGARAAEVVPLPPAVRDNALMFAGELGLSALSSYRLALETLVHHFRSFRETREDFGDGRDIYLDLARGMFGVCRHRAYAFTITALALGIPTHFVMNEAHAWVEVRLPDGDWMRIDLGGAAVGVRTQGDPEAPHYEPRAPDPLPRPPAYRAALARAGNPYGQSDAEGANDPSTSDSNAISEPGATSPEGSDAPNTSGTQGSSAGSSPDGTNTAGTTTGGMSTTGRTNGSARPPGAPRAGVQVRLSAASAEVVRGRAIELEGSIEDEHGAAAASMRVEVLLRGRGERLLGVAVTDAEGRFFGAFGVPHDLAVGDYRLVVRTPGDARHLPAELE
ncbi:MAG: transglutaminase domain-containing protein [Polyangiales bacterium]